ncbi:MULTISPECIES: Na+/H+ antiporter subunit E [unclassified Luteococcus]|uniref:Na+/H+ antiporter subunit E n=1 Tax=unclassified Luteococcus TaxID=2639923 RepID=UPI00313D2B9D
MIRRLRPLPVLGLTAVWLMLMGQFTWANLVFGLVVAAAILWTFPMPPIISTIRVRPVALLVLVGRFLADLLRASGYVAWLALRPRPISAGSLVDVRLRLDDDLRRTLVAELTSLVPGTVVIDLDQGTGVLTLHVLDVTDPELLAAERDRVRALEDRVEAAICVAVRPSGQGATEARLVHTMQDPDEPREEQP